MRIFLSYSRQDQAVARRLADALQAAGLEVWWDHLITGGAAFAQSIETALQEADAVVVLWSRTAVASDWVLDEAAVGRDRHRLLPLSLDGTLAPMGFRQYQVVDLRGWVAGHDRAAFDAVRRGLTHLVEGGGARTVAESLPPIDRRRRWLGKAAVATLVLASGGAAWRWRGGAPAAAPNSVAVLPFDNLGGDPEQNYFADGLGEEVRATLARDLSFQVMAKSSTAQASAQQPDAVGMAQALRVAYLLDGSVRRAGGVVRVAVQLIDGSTGFSRWSKPFERPLADVFAVQTEIANAVVAALREVVGGLGGETLVDLGGARNAEAFDAYLRGRALYELSADEASDRAALAQFDQALRLDENFAAAHAARARSLTALANQYAPADQLATLYDQAVVAAERAIALAPELAEAHSTLGFTLFQGRLDAAAAREPYERSRQLGGGEAAVLGRYAQYAARCGRPDDARDAMQEALRRDPLNPLLQRAAGTIEYAARRYAASLPWFRKALTMNPRLTRAHGAIGDALLLLGELQAAREAYAREPVADMRLAGLAIAESRAGQPATAERWSAELVAEHGDRVRYQQAQIAAQRGDVEAAFQHLAVAQQLGDGGLIYARNDPFLDPLRDDLRMDALLRGLGFDLPARR